MVHKNMNNSNIKESQTFENVWDALASTIEEAENLKLRSTLMQQINSYIKKKNLTQADMAKICRITRPRINDLINGKLSKFSLDSLVNIAANAGLRVVLEAKEIEFV
jgi:predicted XRE-type DNA-binding protein